MKIQHLETTEDDDRRNPKKARIDAEPGDALEKAGIKWMTIVIEDTLPQHVTSGARHLSRAYTIHVEAEDSGKETSNLIAALPSDDDVLFEAIVRDYLSHPSSTKAGE